MADLTALIALLRSALAATNWTTALGALTADVAALTASVASFVILGALRTIAAEVTLVSTIVTFGSATVRAVASLMGCLAASEARSGRVIHNDDGVGMSSAEVEICLTVINVARTDVTKQVPR
ncbi:hypothetical protein F5Y14DRAFT_436950 [Nemania sp. NC0429]|nr:hypothetical protein F5Y14DRAFT_436950 [Nemania sp. NC0429]